MEQETSQKLVDYRVQDGIAILEINNPPANTYTYDVLRELDEAILGARLDETVHVIVIRGKGEKFFCAGADVKHMYEHSSDYRYNFILYGNEILCRLEHTEKLVIVAINGHALGGGLEIALACDIRLAKKDGGKTGLPEVNLGLLPGMGGTQRLPRLIGKGAALELATTGKAISFEEASQMGIIDAIYDQSTFFEDVLEYTRQFLPPNKASKSVGAIKRLVQSGLDMSLANGLALERECFRQAFDSEDAKEGISAFIQKRTAIFKGR